MSNKLNETFQKHLKLLHEHLNINDGISHWMSHDDAEAYHAKEKKDFDDKIDRKVEKLKMPMSHLIKTLGPIVWQRYKRENIETKIHTLKDFYFDNVVDKLSSKGGGYEYGGMYELFAVATDDPNKPLDSEIPKSLAIDILTKIIEKAEKIAGRGFFE